jgi:hypothetical protein
MNLAQKIAIAVTLLAVAVFLFVGGHRVRYWDTTVSRLVDGRIEYGHQVAYTDWQRTYADIVGILLVGGAATLLLGIKRRGAGCGPVAPP